MNITWDHPKRLANIAKHGMDFETLTADYFANALVLSVKNGRYLAIGKDANGVISVVFATLGCEGISVISMRPASRKNGGSMKKKSEVAKAKPAKRGDMKSVSDNPEWTDKMLARARPFAEVFPGLAESIKRSRGRPKVDNPKEAVTLRLSVDTVRKFKAAGDDWRAKMAKALERVKI